MKTTAFDLPKPNPRRHPFGAHGMLLAIPIAVILWALIVFLWSTMV